MKRILLFALLCIISIQGFAQKKSRKKNYEYTNISYFYAPTIITLYGGAGCATANNYNVGPSLGIDFEKSSKSINTRFGLQAFYQQYSLYYDNELNSAKHGTGDAGEMRRHLSSFVFVAPNFSYNLINRVNFMTDVNINAGVGFNISGFDSVRQWDYGHNYQNGYYTPYTTPLTRLDTMIDASKNINSMLIRVGAGLSEYLYIGGKGHHWYFVFKEDFGFIANGLTKTDDAANEVLPRTRFSPQKLNPGYISIQIGISYLKSKNVE